MYFLTQIDVSIVNNSFSESVVDGSNHSDPVIAVECLLGSPLPSDVLISGNKNVCSLLVQLVTTNSSVLVTDNLGQTSAAGEFREWNINTAGVVKVSGNLLSDKQCMRVNSAPGCSVVNNVIMEVYYWVVVRSVLCFAGFCDNALRNRL